MNIMANQKNKMTQVETSKNPWSGRFSEPVSELVQRYTASVGFDRRLADYDIEGSLAHAQMLSATGIIDTDDLAAIRHGLGQIRDEIRSGEFVWRTELEDVHLNIEKRLTALIGDAGKRLHTARSRNDQVATDIRLYLRDSIDAIISLIHMHAARVAGSRRQAYEYSHARLHSFAGGAASGLRPPPHGIFRNAQARCRAYGRLPQACESIAVGRGGAGGHQLSHRSGNGGAGNWDSMAFAKIRWMRFPTGTLPLNSAPRRR